MQVKKCTVCGEEKTLDQYRKYSGRGRFGLRPLCKICQRNYEKKWRSSSKEYRKIARTKRREKDAIYHREYQIKSRAKHLIAECRRRCAKKNIPFDLDAHTEEIQSRMENGFCELTGLPFNKTPSPKRKYNSASIDRIDPVKGYIYSNIRIVLTAVNMMMGDWGLEITKMIAIKLLEK